MFSYPGNPYPGQDGAEGGQIEPSLTQSGYPTMAMGMGTIQRTPLPSIFSTSRHHQQSESRSPPNSNSIKSSTNQLVHQNSTSTPSLSRKVTRVRTGCLTCRRRKKKCDEERCPETGGCMRCKQAGYECEGFPPLRQMKRAGLGPGGTLKKPFKLTSAERRTSDHTANSEDSNSSVTSFSPPHAQQQSDSMSVVSGGGGQEEDAHGLFALQAAASSLMAAPSLPAPPTQQESQVHQFSPDRVSIQDLVDSSQANPNMQIPRQSPAFTSSSSPNVPISQLSNADQQAMQIESDHSMVQGTQQSTVNETSVLPPNRQNQSAFIQPHTQLHQRHGSTSFQHSPPAAQIQQTHPNMHGSGTICTFIGECILVGRAICTACLSTIEPLFSPSDPTPIFHLPTPASSTGATSAAFSPHEARHQPVMQSLIGYYSAVATCWIEGCYPQEIANSTFFRDLVQYLITNIDENESLRLSVAAVASGYIGGGQLQWPEDLVAIQRWTNTLRQDATELVDVTVNVTKNSNVHRNELESGVNGPDKLARHTYIDRHLSKHAMLFYRMAKKSVEDAIQRASRNPSAQHSSSGLQKTVKLNHQEEYIDPALAKKYNNILMATVNLCIFSWAEMSIETYYEDFDLVIQAVHTLFGGIRRVKLAYINSLDTIGLAIVCWADTCAAIARGTRPYFELDESDLTEEEKKVLITHPDASSQFAFHSFNCPKALFSCLNDLARLRFDCKAAPQRAWNGGNTEGGRQSSPLPAFLAQRAAQLDIRLKALTIQTQHTTDANGNRTTITNAERNGGKSEALLHSGSPNCSEMTRLAAILILYSAVYGKGPLHPTCKFALQSIIHLWTYGAIGFCRDVGCSNYLLPMFMASVVACDTRDRLLCEEAMNIVGHNEAVADASRQAVREVWKRTDEAGFPALWTDIVKPGSMDVAFL